jgi:hypothetical protein
VRKAAGESDFTRAARQQEVIAALRDRLVRGAFLDNPSRFLKSLGQTISTNVKPSLIADYIDVASGIPRKDVFRAVIGHPLVRSGYDARGSIQVPQVKRIRELASNLFTPAGVRPKGKGIDTMPPQGDGPLKRASSSSTCGIVRATPSPRHESPRPSQRPPTPPTPRPSPRRSRRPSRRRPSRRPAAEAAVGP